MTPFRRAAGGDSSPLPGCHDWSRLQEDLALSVPAALASGQDLTVAVLELDHAGSRRRRSPAASGTGGDSEVVALLATILVHFADMNVYRVGREAFAVLGQGTDAAAMGECVLLATASAPCRFDWGMASLRRVGAAAAWPEALAHLARADLHLRRRAVAGVHRAATRRRLAAVGSVAAAMLLLAGAAVALGSSPGAPPVTHEAERPATPAAPSAGSPLPAGPPTTTIPVLPVTPEVAPPATPVGPPGSTGAPPADDVVAVVAVPAAQAPAAPSSTSSPTVPSPELSPPFPGSPPFGPGSLQGASAQGGSLEVAVHQMVVRPSSVPPSRAPGGAAAAGGNVGRPPLPARAQGQPTTAAHGAMAFALGHRPGGGGDRREARGETAPGPGSL